MRLRTAKSRWGVACGRRARLRRWRVSSLGARRSGHAPKIAVAASVALDGGRWGFVEPIYAEGLCLTCHGASGADEVGARRASLYPEGQARGYGDGDFRGLFWVEVSPVRTP